MFKGYVCIIFSITAITSSSFLLIRLICSHFILVLICTQSRIRGNYFVCFHYLNLLIEFSCAYVSCCVFQTSFIHYILRSFSQTKVFVYVKESRRNLYMWMYIFSFTYIANSKYTSVKTRVIPSVK